MDGDLKARAGNCAKNMLIAFNVLFLVFGLMAVALGLFIVAFPLGYHVAVLMGKQHYYVAALILIMCGVAVMVVAFLGCCGAKNENKLLLGAFFIAILVIFVVEFMAGVLALFFYTQAEESIEDNLANSLIEAYGIEGEEDTTNAWNYVQWWFECCGYAGNTTEAAAMWTNSIWWVQVTTEVRVPKSCCSVRNRKIVNLKKCQDRQNIDWYTHINNQGCYDAVYRTAVQYSSMLAGAGIILSLIQLLGMGFSYCLFLRL